MVAKSRRVAPTPSRVEQLWEKYGTWIISGVVLVLLVVLSIVLVRRYLEGKVRQQREEFAAVSHPIDASRLQGPEQLKAYLPQAERELRQQLVSCENPKLRAQIELRLAQILLKQESYADAEAMLVALDANEHLSRVDRALVHLALAYAAQGQNKLAEARTHWERVIADKLYVMEARTQIALIDKTLKKKSTAGGVAAPE